MIGSYDEYLDSLDARERFDDLEDHDFAPTDDELAQVDAQAMWFGGDA